MEKGMSRWVQHWLDRNAIPLIGLLLITVFVLIVHYSPPARQCKHSHRECGTNYYPDGQGNIWPQYECWDTCDEYAK